MSAPDPEDTVEVEKKRVERARTPPREVVVRDMPWHLYWVVSIGEDGVSRERFGISPAGWICAGFVTLVALSIGIGIGAGRLEHHRTVDHGDIQRARDSNQEADRGTQEQRNCQGDHDDGGW